MKKVKCFCGVKHGPPTRPEHYHWTEPKPRRRPSKVVRKIVR